MSYDLNLPRKYGVDSNLIDKNCLISPTSMIRRHLTIRRTDYSESMSTQINGYASATLTETPLICAATSPWRVRTLNFPVIGKPRAMPLTDEIKVRSSSRREAVLALNYSKS